MSLHYLFREGVKVRVPCGVLQHVSARSGLACLSGVGLLRLMNLRA